MLVRRFLDRLGQADPARRAQIVRALVRVFDEVELDDEHRAGVVTAMTAILDDPAPRVRRALAEALADDPAAPRHVVLALSDDQPDIAEIVLSRSLVFSETELIDAAGSGSERLRAAIASREHVSVGLAAALVEVSGSETCLALLSNPGATLTLSSFQRLVERHRKDAAVRSALLERIDLPITLRQALIDGLSEALRDLVQGREWLGAERADRVLRDARDRAVVDLTLTSDVDRLRALVEQLAAEHRLTPMLIIRAVCLGNPRFLDISLSVLAGMPTQRVISLIYERHGTGITAVCRRAGLPEIVVPAFRAMADTLRDLEPDADVARSTRAGSGMIDRILERYGALTGGATDEFHALIGRLAAEAARDEARSETGGYICAA